MSLSSSRNQDSVAGLRRIVVELERDRENLDLVVRVPIQLNLSDLQRERVMERIFLDDLIISIKLMNLHINLI